MKKPSWGLKYKIGMISNRQDNIRIQAEEHDLIPTEGFKTGEEEILFLIHLKAYEEAKKMIQNKTVLDLGCNKGYGTKVISGFCNKVIGADISLRAIKEARRKYGPEGIDVVIIDGMQLPFEDEKFDIVLCFQVIEHVSDYSYLNEIKRVLSPDGRVIFTTPNALIRLDPFMKPWNRFHIREFNAKELKELLHDYFSKVEIRGLFAKEPLYSIELNRNKRYLEKARLTTKRTYAFRAVIKSILPNAAVDTIRSLCRLMRDKKINQINAKQYSSNDLFYRNDNLAKALDLLAICDKNF